jgi:N,N-dimethylformamidase beta subunit-like, C-terminal/Domain of unknown function (DUF4082)/Concanavalin A-like lectin/glucanases superfamily/Bacterial Ig-like domain/Bacterial Ig domain
MKLARLLGVSLNRSSTHKHKARRIRLRLDSLDDRIVPSGNPIVAENQLPGNSQSEWDVVGDGDPTLQGFTTEFSVNHGQTLSFKVNDSANAFYHIDIYRIGYYGGAGARKVASIPSSQTLRQVQPTPLKDLTTGLVDAGNWAVSASWTVPSTATSGVYIAKLVREDTGGASLVYFVVRDDEGHSDLLVQTSDTTWQAYNAWGGYSLYTAPQAGTAANPNSLTRAAAVSYNRPIVLRGLQGGNGSYNSFFHAEYPMVRWLEANGYNVSYTSDIDSDRRGAEILEHNVFISSGHDEYWSAQQRTNVEAARDAGVNLAFFSGNEVYWKTRWANSIDSTATPYRTLISYKESKDNAKTDPTPIWTGTWRDMRFSPPADGGRPENALTGTLYMADRTSTDIGIAMQVSEADGKLWFWRGTAVANLAPGQVATIGDRVVGYETDEDVDNGFRPAGLITLSSTTFNTTSKVIVDWGTVVGAGTSTHKMTMYRAPSGALVFGAGTVQWSWGLDGSHDDTPSTPDPSIRQATVNLLTDMGVQPGTPQPGIMPTAVSMDLTRPTSTITSPAAGSIFSTGTTVTITGTASDAGGGLVGGVEVSTDGGLTWHRASGRTNWTYNWSPATAGPATILSRAADDRGNVEIPSSGVNVSVVYGATSTTGLVAAFSMNAGSGTTVADSSSANNAGTISGASWSTAGMFGGALSFNGTNNWVTVADSASLDITGALTMEAWVKPMAANGFGTVLFKERSGGDTYSLYAVNGASQPPAAYVNVGGAGIDATIQGPAQLPLNAWSHLAATYNGSVLSFFVNGNLVSTAPANGSVTTSNGALRIGGNSVFGDYFQGLIDEVRVYSRALTQGEIRSDMSTPIGGTLETTAPTVAMTTPSGNVSGTVTLSATASDNVSVAGVQFLVNGQPVGAEDTTAPYSFNWNSATVTNGTYSVTARARDVAGNTSTSQAVTLTVTNSAESTPPTVAITNLTAGSTVGGTIILSATASDNIGVVGVQFKANGANVGPEITAAPYQVPWNTTGLTSGVYTITAVARDAAGNSTTSSGIQVTVDSTAPTITVRTPVSGATGVATDIEPTVTFSEAIDATSLIFTLKDAAGNPLATSVSYDVNTLTARLSHTSALATLATYTVSVSGARDLIGNVMSAPISWSFTTAGTITGASVWGDTGTPAVAAFNDSDPQELGFKFRSSTAGSVTGVRFYKGPGNTGTHVGHLWASDGVLLASATFTAETTSGWQEVLFANPVPIAANTTYVASYYAPNGHYAFTSNYFSAPVNSYPLKALANGEDGGNGVFRGGPGGGFPNQSFNSANYWVDVLFNGASADTAAPLVVNQSPADGSTEVAVGSVITVAFSEPVQASTISMVLKDASNIVVPASISYDPGTWTATLTPSSPLAGSATYTATVSGARDATGNLMPGSSTWSFTTAAVLGGSSVWSTTTTPSIAAFNDSGPQELGFKFRSNADGSITGVRFYKGAGNTGTHVGHLWAADGTLLATATFASETGSGWQEVSFSSPVPITANTTYVASYYAPNGHYAYTSGYFATGVDNGPLRALSNGESGGNGVFRGGVGGGFPNQSFNSANYWVDVVFNATPQDTLPPVVIAHTPAPGSSGVPVGTVVTATFSEPVQANTISFVLKDAANNTVSATVAYDAANRIATLTPTSALAVNTAYTATVTGATDQVGNVMTVPVSWSFTTPAPVTNATLWTTGAAPAVSTVADPGPNELGFRFYSDVAGYISGIRFYKGVQNTGTHVGHLWATDGTLLASATFSNESASGWQQVNFFSPVNIAANTQYIASYYTPTGYYSVTNDYFVNTSVDSSPLHAPADGANGANGVYRYASGGGFPTSTYRSSNYWVDVVFSQNSTDFTPPTVTAVTPANGSIGVSPNADLTIVFNEAVQASSISLVVKDAFNVPVVGNLSYNGSTKTATFTPATPLLSFMNYTATVSGVKDLSGNTLASPYSWSFKAQGVWTQTSVNDFNSGTTNGTMITNNDGGEIQLAPLLQDEFNGTALNGTDWTTTSWTFMGGGPTVVTVSSGTTSIGGGAIFSAQSYTNIPVEGRVQFGAATYPHFGLATGLSTAAGNYWAMFSTRDTTDRLFARVNSNGSSADVDLGPLPTGFHKYKVEPTSTGFKFYLDGTLKTTISATFQSTQPMKATISDFIGSPSIQSDWVRFYSFSTTQSGTFTSSVFDVGTTVDWDKMILTSDAPTGTTVKVETISSLDGVSWTNWQEVSGTALPSADGRYLRYRITLTTTDPAKTPVIRDISFTWK